MGALNTKIIYRFLGVTAMLNGLFMFLTVPFSIYHNEPEKWGILNAGIITVFIGVLLYFLNKPTNTNILEKRRLFNSNIRLVNNLFYRNVTVLTFWSNTKYIRCVF